MSADNALLTLLNEKLKNNLLVLPTLPEIAVRVRQAADDPDINLNSMAEVISRDPALAARMIKVANSAFLGRTIKVANLAQAVTRIGLSQVKNIATAMALEQLFVSHNQEVATAMKDLWSETMDVTCIAMACLKYYMHEHKHCNLNNDTMALAALVHRIGVLPILAEAERHPTVFAEPHYLHHAIRDFAAEIGLAIVKSWQFADLFYPVVTDWLNADRHEHISYVDFVRLGLMARGSFASAEQQAELLDYYIAQGLVPDANFMAHPEIAQSYQDARTMFV